MIIIPIGLILDAIISIIAYIIDPESYDDSECDDIYN